MLWLAMAMTIVSFSLFVPVVPTKASAPPVRTLPSTSWRGSSVPRTVCVRSRRLAL